MDTKNNVTDPIKSFVPRKVKNLKITSESCNVDDFYLLYL